MISVLLPVAPHEKESSYVRTIKSILTTNKHRIEILFLSDGWIPSNDFLAKQKEIRICPSDTNLGERITVNRGVKLAQGNIIFRLDAHAKVLPNWSCFVSQCKPNMLVSCPIYSLNENTWEFDFLSSKNVCITPWLEEVAWKTKDKSSKTMTNIGCGWYCDKNYFLNNLMFDEDLAKWGNIGTELSAKVERSGGTMELCENVPTGHVFNTSKLGYCIEEQMKTREVLHKRYAKFILNLGRRLGAPLWGEIEDDYETNWLKYRLYNVSFTKELNFALDDAKIQIVFEPYKFLVKNYEDIIPARNTAMKKKKPISKIKVFPYGNNDYEITNKQEIEKWIKEHPKAIDKLNEDNNDQMLYFEDEQQAKHAFPSLFQQTKSFTSSAIKQITAGHPKRTEDEIKRIQEICNDCEFFVQDKKRCKKCGCYMNVKQRWKTSHCKIGKW